MNNDKEDPMALKTLGLGDNVADYYVHTNTIYPGGCCFNFAAYSSMLGNKSAYLGIVGNDFAAKHIMKTADELGIDTSRCHVKFGPTPRPAVEIINGERFFPDTDNSNMGTSMTLVLNQKDLAYIAGFDLVHTDVYAGTEQLMEDVKALGVTVITDYSTEYSDMYFKANCKNTDYAIMSCSHIPLEQMYEQIRKAHGFGAKGVLATRGLEGSWFSDETKLYHRDATNDKALDTQGAGDAFLTAFFSSYIGWQKNGGDIRNCSARETAIYAALEAASKFAGKIVQIDGAFGHGVTYQEESNLF